MKYTFCRLQIFVHSWEISLQERLTLGFVKTPFTSSCLPGTIPAREKMSAMPRVATLKDDPDISSGDPSADEPCRAPDQVEFSVSERLSTKDKKSICLGNAGDISPNSTCTQRKLSTVLTTSEDAHHELLDGRTKIVLPNFDRLNSNKPTTLIMPRPSMVKRSLTVPIDDRMKDFTQHPPPLRLDAWAEPPATNFKVRGKNYLQDSIKFPSEPSVFQLLTVDLVKVDEPIFTGLCSHPHERIQQALRREKATGHRELPQFIFAVNLCVPGQSYYHWVAYFGIDDLSVIQNQATPFGRVASRFFFGDSDEFRRKTFKLIPRIADGNFVVRKTVGSKPAILGRKLKQYYIRDDRFMELIVNIGSEKMAERIVKLALGYAKTLVVDMMFLLEGAEEDLLPERILGGKF